MFRATNHVRLMTNAIPVYLFRRTIGRSPSRHEEDHFSEIPTASSSKKKKRRRERSQRKEEEKEEKWKESAQTCTSDLINAQLPLV